MLSPRSDITYFQYEVFGDLGLKIQTVPLKDRRTNVLIKRKHALQQVGIHRGLVRNELRESSRVAEKWIAYVTGKVWYRHLHQAEGLVGELLDIRLPGDSLVEDAITPAQDQSL